MTSKFPISLTKFYTEEQLMKAFGKLDPDLNERTDYFDGLWFAFMDNEISTRDIMAPEGMTMSQLISKLRREYGPFNIVRRGQRLRFRHAEDAVFVRLTYSK